MGLFAGGLWFAYIQGMRHAVSAGGSGEVPLIRADERPTKVKPDKPGGMEIPDRDKLIYTQKRAAVEHLLPAPEKPMARPTPPSASSTQPEAAAPPASPEAAVVPSTLAPSPLAPSPLAPSEATAAVTGPRTTAGPTTETASLPIPPQQQSAAALPTKPAPASPQPAKTGGVRLQLGSLRSEDAARQEWDRIRRANSDLLGSLSATTERADLGDRGIFYRIQTSPVADANRLCGELKRRNVGCIIAR
jgi:hypothetical protein